VTLPLIRPLLAATGFLDQAAADIAERRTWDQP
jgi:hypothetical protein